MVSIKSTKVSFHDLDLPDDFVVRTEESCGKFWAKLNWRGKADSQEFPTKEEALEYAKSTAILWLLENPEPQLGVLDCDPVFSEAALPSSIITTLTDVEKLDSRVKALEAEVAELKRILSKAI